MKNLSLKLLAIQKELKPIVKDSVNPHFKNKYFDINSVIAELRPLLNKHGVVVMQPLVDAGIETTVIDTESGETFAKLATLPEAPDAQKMGAAISYFRRYALVSMFLLEGEADDDGNSTAAYVAKAMKVPQKGPVDEYDAPPPPFDGETDTTPSALGNCSKCGAPNAFSKAKQKPYCSRLCWKS